MMLAMETEKIPFWVDVYNRVVELARQPGWNEARIAQSAGMSPRTLNSFKLQEGARAMHPATWAKLRPVLDAHMPSTAESQQDDVEFEPPPPEDSSKAHDPHLIPVLNLDDFDFDAEGEAMEERIEEGAEFHMFLPGAKRGRDVLLRTETVVRLRKGTVLPTDLLLVTRAKTRHKAGRVAVLRIGRRGFLADIEESQGTLLYVLPTGERVEDPDVFGTVRFRLDDWE